MIIVTRNTHDYGPYDEALVARFVEEGKLLLHDKARDAVTGEEATIEDFLNLHGLHPQIKSNGSLLRQIAYIGENFIFPHRDIVSSDLHNDRRLLILAIVGLSLSVLMMLPIGGLFVFYGISLYFATIWGMFFYAFFRTRQVKLKTTVFLFFLTQLGVFIIFSGLNRLNFFYLFTHFNFPLSIVGYVFGVGITEEFTKMLPLLYLEKRSREPILAQTLVYYGLMAGIAFGVFEGVEYQTTVNINADYTSAFLLNIARLTSLPFMHAVWAGIAGYFVAMANLYPRYRHGLYALALVIPATLHGLYDSFVNVNYLVSLLIAFVSVILLMTYLRKTSSLREKLRR